MLNPKYNVHIFENKNALDRAAADFWLQQAQQAITERGSFHVALTGGSTPQSMYRLLASKDFADQLDWSKVHIYIGDERYVAHTHPDSNFGMVKDCLLDHVPIPQANLHPVPTDEQEAEIAAQRYATELQNCLSTKDNTPQLDLIMLGMGDDGHTASLFPGTDILQVTDKTVAAVYVEKLSSWRVSMTYPILNTAHQIMFMIGGDNKADILAHVLKQGSEHIYPVQGIDVEEGMHWFLDKAAASKLD